MTNLFTFKRHCKGFSPKQSISATYESLENFLFYANLWLDLLIRSLGIAIHSLLKSRDLDCFGLFTKALAMTKKWRESAIRLTMTILVRIASIRIANLAMTIKTHPLAPSAREGELAELPPAMNVESQINPKDPK